MHELAPRPSPSSVEMTRHRLWLLYCLAGFRYGEIEELTGWKYAAIKNGIRRWNLARLSLDEKQPYWQANLLLIFKMLDQLDDPLDDETRSLLVSSQEVVRKWIDKQIAKGERGWTKLDALPGPDKVGRWVEEWIRTEEERERAGRQDGEVNRDAA